MSPAAPAPAKARPAPREIVDGRYELVGQIGKGGMGTVYRAIQRPIGREVALKLLRRADLSDPDRAARRFVQEARAIADLHHPHVVPLFDFGETADGDRYLVMELLPGESLGEVMRRDRRLGLTRTLGILDQVLDALAEAHGHGIVHRDLKPENIQLGRRGERSDFVTVLDFGIARTVRTSVGSDSRTTIEVAGTPAYMAPEQILGTAIDPRTDLYAVGVLFFEMLTGRLPFDAEKSVDIYVGHLRHAVPRLADHGGPTDDALDAFVERALAKNTNDRFQDAPSMRRALRGLSAPRAVPLRPVAPARRPLEPAETPAPTVAQRTPERPQALPRGLELVAVAEPSGDAEALVAQWTLKVAECGGVVAERDGSRLRASFHRPTALADAIQAAVALKAATRAERLGRRRALHVRVGVHEEAAIALRLCDEAPRDGIAAAVTADVADVRFEPAPELRLRGRRVPVFHVVSRSRASADTGDRKSSP